MYRKASVLKVAHYAEFSWSTNLEPKLIKLFVFVNFEQTVHFGSLEPFTVCKIGDFPLFLSALASNNQFIIKLVKMWPGGTLYVVVGTLKISLDRLKNNTKRSLVECCSVSCCSRVVDLENTGECATLMSQ